MQRLTRTEWGVWLGCAYECVALLGPRDRLPPISRICWRSWPVGCLVMGWLGQHLFRPPAA